MKKKLATMNLVKLWDICTRLHNLHSTMAFIMNAMDEVDYEDITAHMTDALGRIVDDFTILLDIATTPDEAVQYPREHESTRADPGTR